MCGRFTLTSTPEELARRFGLAEIPAFAPRYNIAPAQSVLVVRSAEDGARRAAALRWGLVPAWAATPDPSAGWINARIETLAEKPAFRDAFRARRCLVPADGFYEWADHGGFRQPYRIALPGGGLFAFAGLWERWRDAQGGVIESCAIVTREASPALRPLHDRMPVVLPDASFAEWLAPSQREVAPLRALLEGAPAPDFAIHPVSTRVNTPRHDDPACAQPAPAAPRQESLF
jgi:putative SOS response-associated peptidase YedK